MGLRTAHNRRRAPAVALELEPLAHEDLVRLLADGAAEEEGDPARPEPAHAVALLDAVLPGGHEAVTW